MPMSTLLDMARPFVAAAAMCAGPAAWSQDHAERFGVSAESLQRLDDLDARAHASPDDAGAWLALAREELAIARRTREHHDLHHAEAAFERVLQLNPDSAEAHIGLAYARIGLHRFSDALISAREASALAPDQPEVLALLGDAHLALGHQAEARAMFELLAARDLTLESLSRLALAAADRGEREQAERLMRDAQRAGELLGAPAESRAWCMEILGDLAWESGRLDDARAAYDAALRLDAGAAHARMMRARVDARQGRVEDADKALSGLARTHPRPAHWLALADVLLARGEPTDAERAATLVQLAEGAMLHELADHDVGHARELAELWLAHGGDAHRAAELALRDLREVRQDAGAYETAAWALHRAGRSAEALPLAMRALRANPANARATWRAGIIHAALQRPREASLLLRRALELNPALDPAMREEGERALAAIGTDAAPRGNE